MLVLLYIIPIFYNCQNKKHSYLSVSYYKLSNSSIRLIIAVARSAIKLRRPNIIQANSQILIKIKFDT